MKLMNYYFLHNVLVKKLLEFHAVSGMCFSCDDKFLNHMTVTVCLQIITCRFAVCFFSHFWRSESGIICNGPTLHSIFFGLGLHCCTHGFPSAKNVLARMLGPKGVWNVMSYIA